MINTNYIEPFQNIFVSTYNTVHRLEIGQMCNVAKMFTHLLFADAHQVHYQLLHLYRPGQLDRRLEDTP